MANIDTLVLGSTDTTSSPYLSTATYTFTGSYLIVKLNDVTAYPGNNDAVIVNEGGTFRMIALSFGADKWALRNCDGSYASTGTILTFGGTDSWLKIEFGVSDTLYYTSTDGASWTLRYTDTGVATGADYDGKKLRLNQMLFDQVGTAASGSPFRAWMIG